MNILSTKEMILDYLILKTKEYGCDYPQYFTTKRISYELNSFRSLTSQYLNELCKEDKLIKVNSRPVFYFDKKSLEKKYKVTLKETEFYNMADLINAVLNYQEENDVFKNVIGSDGSLYQCIIQLKTAISYPPHGLPLILRGEGRHLGYEYLLKLLFEYGKEKHILSSKAKYKCIEVESDNSEEIDKILFKEDGTFALDDMYGGILYIENAHLLPKRIQRKVADVIQEEYVLKQTKIFLGVDSTEEELDKHLLTSIPFICDFPSWGKRNLYEREQFVISFFKKEEEKLKKKIYISNNAFQALAEYRFIGNLNEVRNTIKTACVNAWSRQKEREILEVDRTNLPSFIPYQYINSKAGAKEKEQTGFYISEWKHIRKVERVVSFFDRLLDAHIHYQENHVLFSEFCEQGLGLLREYYDFIVFDGQYNEEQLKQTEEGIERILKTVSNIHQIKLPLNCSFVLARIANYTYSQGRENLIWETKRKNDLQMCLETFMKQMPDETMIAMEIHRNLMSTMDINLGKGGLIFIILNIHFYNKDIPYKDTCGLIVSHGYSTATSIADACNQLLKYHVFEAIDMPLDTQVDEIIAHILSFIRLYPYYQNLILLVDMGSLLEIGNELKIDMNIGVINNISTGLALEVGSAILQKKDLETLLKEACEKAQCHYQVIAKQQKDKAIIFTSDAGMNVCRRLVELFQNSLMSQIELRFIEYDYDTLSQNKEDDIIFKKYDVGLVVKPHSLELEGIPSLSLEDIVGFRDIDKLHDVLKEYLNREEIELFDQNLIKNFSLQNIMGNLTILNPSRLMDEVSDAIGHLQKLMGRKFHSMTLAGIYIHVSFLMERLVTKKAIETHEDLDVFRNEQKTFIAYVKESFLSMMEHYNVEMPISEIAYLYDYIVNDKNNKEGKL